MAARTALADRHGRACGAARAAARCLKSYGLYLLSYWLVFVIATMGLNLTVGYAGQASLGHAAFLGIGAYSVAIVMKAGLQLLARPAAAARCCASCSASGWGFPALRVQTIYLAFATLGSTSPRGWSCATRNG